MSGLNQRFTKPPNLNRFREFESHRLRKIRKPERVFSAIIPSYEYCNYFIVNTSSYLVVHGAA